MVQLNCCLPTQAWLISKEREYLYSLLALLFRSPPTPKTLEIMLSPGIITKISSILKRVPYAKAEHAGQILEMILYTCKEISRKREYQFQQEFASLFLAHNGISPFETDYLYSQPYYKKVAREMLKLTYEIAGPLKRRDFYPLDHISVELDFAAVLIRQEARKTYKSQGLMIYQQLFLKDHLVRWVPLFCREIETMLEPEMFYHQIAQVTGSLINLDQGILNIRAETNPVMTG